MIRKIHARLTYANVMATFAVFLALGGTALGAVIITSNSQVAQGTISGHHPPTGKHPNIIAGSVNGTDVAAASIGSTQLNKGPSYTNAGLQNSWTNFGFGSAAAGYYKDPLGLVHLRGVIQGGTSDTVAFTLPLGLRPTHNLFVAVGAGGPEGGLAQVASTGTVTVSCESGGTGCIIGLDGVTFRAGQ
jgi:hypothetical protein